MSGAGLVQTHHVRRGTCSNSPCMGRDLFKLTMSGARLVQTHHVRRGTCSNSPCMGRDLFKLTMSGAGLVQTHHVWGGTCSNSPCLARDLFMLATLIHLSRVDSYRSTLLRTTLSLLSPPVQHGGHKFVRLFVCSFVRLFVCSFVRLNYNGIIIIKTKTE